MSLKRSEQTLPKLVLAFDIGTAYSGISYSILDPRSPEYGKVRRVDSFDAQEDSSNTRSPNVLYYNSEGALRSIGAAALRNRTEFQAEERGWTKVDRLKLLLNNNPSDPNNDRLSELPPDVSVEEVLADLLRYLDDYARRYIGEKHQIDLDGLKGQIRYIVPHPNDWDQGQQQLVRKAAFLAGILANEGSSDLIFVSDGEAVFHYFTGKGDFQMPVDPDQGVLMISAGAGFVNFSGFARSPDNRRYEEIIAAQSIVGGSSFVTDEARAFVRYWFRDCRFSGDADFIAERFDKTVKLDFDDDHAAHYIQFASSRDNDPELDVQSGRLRLGGGQIAHFFDPFVDKIISVIDGMLDSIGEGRVIKDIALVGGFSASPWLFQCLRSAFDDCNLIRPEDDILNAVADGAIYFYKHRYIASRITRYTYGVKSSIKFDKSNTEHRIREASKQEQHDGTFVLPNAFDIILPKETQVRETKEYRRRYHIKSLSRGGLRRREVQLLCYKGDLPTPKWTDVEPELFEPVNVIDADMSNLARLAVKKIGPGGKTYYDLKHDVILTFGASGVRAWTEVRAQIGWTMSVSILHSHLKHCEFTRFQLNAVDALQVFTYNLILKPVDRLIRDRSQPKSLDVPYRESFDGPGQTVRFA
ncbi:hypothetical protein AMATHDRAFT_152239 [Amanita thiersii Skay4041]|uniref:Uncharacterized protein n=1 Tax=Amanita thiersii Skay4041 TaxID=703135 RepID=A0A2A9NI81_9AGAR|nr:hypothetical protein AMATHDRAFT_152239 [Amanita thiersii Skay4041]